MNLKNVEKQEKGTAVLTIEVSAQEFDSAINKVYNRQKNKIQIPGFRKGKAPRSLVEKMYGAEVFYEDAINDLYPDVLTAAVKESGLEIVGYPNVEMDGVPSKEGFTFKATIGLKPVPAIGEYKGLSAEKASTEVTDEDVENALWPFVKRATTNKEVERAAANGDIAVIDFEGFKDGVAFEGGKGDNYELELGSNTFIPGFEDQVVGMSAGEEKDVNVTFPEDYGASDLAGAPVVFKVKCNAVKEVVKPVLDDEFAKDVSEFDTLDEFKANLRQTESEKKTEKAEKAFKDAILSKLIDNLDAVIPETMVEYEADQMIENYASQFQGQQFTFEQYLQMMGMSMEQLKDEARVGALRQIQSDLAFTAVAEKEGFEATEEEINAQYASLAEEYKMEESVVRARIPEESVKSEVCLKKAQDLVYGSAVAAEPEAPAAE